jgi:general secretion pathway protein J
MKRRFAAGFTLVEVLVALMVMAIMAVMAWQGVDGIVRARDANQARLERSLRLNTVIAQWEQDLAAVQDTTVVPSALSARPAGCNSSSGPCCPRTAATPGCAGPARP